MDRYYIDGEVAFGEDYRRAIMEIDLDSLNVVNFEIDRRPGLAVTTDVDGLKFIRDESDGSVWGSTSAVEPTKACEYVEAYLASQMDWVEDLTWEQIAYSSKGLNQRTLRLLIPGVILIAVVWWLLRQ